MLIKTTSENKALFFNGIYEDVLKEILKAALKHPGKSFYLQPYDASQIVELRSMTPTPDNPLALYASTTSELNEVQYQAEIIGWYDKQALFSPENKALHDDIVNHLNTFQPGEGSLYQTKGKSKCANLIVIRNLQKINKPFTVSLLIKVGNGESLKFKSRPGKWSVVLKKVETAEDNITLKSVFDKSFDDEVVKSQKDSQKIRQKRLLTANPFPSRSNIISYAFNRNPDVVAEVLLRSQSVCELCKSNAPFNKATDGSPYLEVHHWIPLADGGNDTVEKAVALCPNCHKQAHYGVNKEHIKIHHTLPQPKLEDKTHPSKQTQPTALELTFANSQS